MSRLNFEKLKSVCEQAQDTFLQGYSVYPDEEEKFIALKTYSPNGEDVFITLWVKNRPVSRELSDMAQDFDLDSYVLRWLQAKENGVSGVLGAEELVEDGKWRVEEYKRLKQEFERLGL